MKPRNDSESAACNDSECCREEIATASTKPRNDREQTTAMTVRVLFVMRVKVLSAMTVSVIVRNEVLSVILRLRRSREDLSGYNWKNVTFVVRKIDDGTL